MNTEQAYTKFIHEGGHRKKQDGFSLFKAGYEAREKELADQEGTEVEERLERTPEDVQNNAILGVGKTALLLANMGYVMREIANGSSYAHAECQGCHRAVLKETAKQGHAGYYCDDCFETENPILNHNEDEKER